MQDQLEAEAGGIRVDGHMRTSNADVYAIGDVAAFPLPLLGGRVVRQEHVTNCERWAPIGICWGVLSGLP